MADRKSNPKFTVGEAVTWLKQHADDAEARFFHKVEIVPKVVKVVHKPTKEAAE